MPEQTISVVTMSNKKTGIEANIEILKREKEMLLEEYNKKKRMLNALDKEFPILQKYESQIQNAEKQVRDKRKEVTELEERRNFLEKTIKQKDEELALRRKRLVDLEEAFNEIIDKLLVTNLPKDPDTFVNVSDEEIVSHDDETNPFCYIFNKLKSLFVL